MAVRSGRKAPADIRQGLLAAAIHKVTERKYAERLTNAEHIRSALQSEDICDWAEREFFIPATSKPIKLFLFQKGILRWLTQRGANGRFRFSTVLYGTVKKSGKSTIGGLVARWVAEAQTRYGEVYTVGNDAKQARERGFKEARRSIELTPGFMYGRRVLPGRWDVREASMRCHLTGSKIEAIAVDARGEAGGHPAFSLWTELWGYEHTDALRFWDEMTRDPTQPDSVRWVETYAGYDGESMLLYGLYEAATKNGRQITNREFAEFVCRDVDGERYEDFLLAFAETNGDPDAFVPLYANDDGGIGAYWDSGPNARRLPWQDEDYYRQEEATLPPRAYRRLHFNEWVGAEGDFVPIEMWDACYDAELPELMPFDFPNDRRSSGPMCVLGLDAAATGDCFAAVLVTRHPADTKIPAIRKVKLWTPGDFVEKRIDFSQVEEWIRQVCKAYNVVQICYDPYQLEDMMQRLKRERVAWCDAFDQGHDRLESDRGLYGRIMQMQIAHQNQPELRQHVANANAKLQKDEDSKMRIVKKATNRKVDAIVATSMAVQRCMYLNL